MKVAESKNKTQLQEWKTAFDSRDKYVKKITAQNHRESKQKSSHEMLMIQKAKQAEGKPGFESIEWRSVYRLFFFFPALKYRTPGFQT